MEKCALSAMRTTGMEVNLMSDTVTECHYKLSHEEKNHKPFEQSILQQYELSFKKLLDIDKTSLMLSQTIISVEHCSLLITQFHTNIKVSVKSHLFQKQDILGAAVNMQQH